MKSAIRGSLASLTLGNSRSPCDTPSRSAPRIRGLAASIAAVNACFFLRACSGMASKVTMTARSARSLREITSPTLVIITGFSTVNSASSASVRSARVAKVPPVATTHSPSDSHSGMLVSE
jgi:hypothetical protein